MKIILGDNWIVRVCHKSLTPEHKYGVLESGAKYGFWQSVLIFPGRYQWNISRTSIWWIIPDFFVEVYHGHDKVTGL